MSIIKNSFESSTDFGEFLNKYIDFYVDAVKKLKTHDFTPFMDLIYQCHKDGKKIIIFGNGGSAANATHLSTGFSFITRSWDRPIKSMTLAADPILLTSLANDFAFEDVFYRQLQVHLEPGDLVLALSVSGKSKNVLKAVRYAKDCGNKIVSLTGSNGGELKGLSDISVHIESDETLFGVTEDVHMVLGHALTYFLEYHLKKQSK